MNTEVKMLAWTVALGLAQIVVQATISTLQRGVAWNTSARDGESPPVTPLAGRVERALRNLLETFPFFAAAVLAAVATNRTGEGTALGAQVYFWARLAYVVVYAAGVPYLRTLIWGVSMVGLVKVLLPLF